MPMRFRSPRDGRALRLIATAFSLLGILPGCISYRSSEIPGLLLYQGVYGELGEEAARAAHGFASQHEGGLELEVQVRCGELTTQTGTQQKVCSDAARAMRSVVGELGLARGDATRPTDYEVLLVVRRGPSSWATPTVLLGSITLGLLPMGFYWDTDVLAIASEPGRPQEDPERAHAARRALRKLRSGPWDEGIDSLLPENANVVAHAHARSQVRLYVSVLLPTAWLGGRGCRASSSSLDASFGALRTDPATARRRGPEPLHCEALSHERTAGETTTKAVVELVRILSELK